LGPESGGAIRAGEYRLIDWAVNFSVIDIKGRNNLDIQWTIAAEDRKRQANRIIRVGAAIMDALDEGTGAIAQPHNGSAYHHGPVN
jgi:hypothetical protein